MRMIEARMTRVGTTNKPTLPANDDRIVFDFDVFGSTMPTQQDWLKTTAAMGLKVDNDIAVQEASEVFCGPRLLLMLRSAGFNSAQSEASNLDRAAPKFDGFIDLDEMVKAVEKKTLVIDVRSAARFNGHEADPRPQVRAGHIPGSINMPYRQFLDPKIPTQLLHKQALFTLFDEAGVDLSQPCIFSCGSGITACIGALAALQCGATHCLVYDGSWSEWGANHNLPIATL